MGTGGTSLPLTPTIFKLNISDLFYDFSTDFPDTLGKALDRLVLTRLTPHDAYTLSLSTS